jgi:hypothetical protein
MLTSFDIKALVDVLPGKPSWKLGHVRIMGLKAYYFLMIWKEGNEPEVEQHRSAKVDEKSLNREAAVSSILTRKMSS